MATEPTHTHSLFRNETGALEEETVVPEQRITVWPAEGRGRTSLDWLESRHSFSFGSFHDAQRIHHGSLRVLNEDWVKPSGGFAPHPHKDMEIVTYVVSGQLQHQDSMGNGSIIEAGCFQRMSAGTGITHSEFNPSSKEDVHLLQIWFLPAEAGIAPSYQEQNAFPIQNRDNALNLVLSQNGREGSMQLNQDVDVYMVKLNAQERTISHVIGAHRKGWVQMVKGRIILNGKQLQAGDGVAVEAHTTLQFSQGQNTEFLLFDMG
jgi:quercetin 2,3-dioxygenase